MWVRCDACRRYAPLSIGGLQDVDYRSKTFSCSQCGSEAYLVVIEPINEAGMQDYHLDAIERPERHPAVTDRLTGRGRSAPMPWLRWSRRAPHTRTGMAPSGNGKESGDVGRP
jgi:hypothetical protein